MVVTRGKPFGNSFISGHDQPKWKHRVGRASRVAVGVRVAERQLARSTELAGIGRSDLSRPESLITPAGVIQGLIEFPTEAVIQSYVRADLPAVLRQQVDRISAHVFGLRRSLQVRIGKTHQVVGEKVLSSVGEAGRDEIVWSAAREGEVAVRVEVQGLEEALISKIDTELGGMVSES